VRLEAESDHEHASRYELGLAGLMTSWDTIFAFRRESWFLDGKS
jgi:hypothetical protein